MSRESRKLVVSMEHWLTNIVKIASLNYFISVNTKPRYSEKEEIFTLKTARDLNTRKRSVNTLRV